MNHKTPKQEKMAEANAIAKTGKVAYLCRFTFSGNYFVIEDDKPRPDQLWHREDHPNWEVVTTYGAQ